MVNINWSNVTGIEQFPAQANVAYSGFWSTMMFMVWIILILILIEYGFEIAILAASFVMLIIGLILVYAGLVAWQYLMVFVAVIILMFLYITWSTRRGRT